jgi:glycosyltransferase involved in cell wall biosynthesis
MRVVYNLCQEWKKTKEVKVIVLTNTPISLLRFRFEPHVIPLLRRTLIMCRTHSHRFDILNVHGVSRNGVEISKLCKKYRVPIVYTAHGVAKKEKELGYAYSDEFLRQEKLMFSLADRIVAVSPMLKKLLVDECGLPEEKVNVVYNGVDPSFGRKKYRHIDVRKKYSIPNNRKILLNVGGTRKVKDIPFLIKALELLKRKDWHLVLIGAEGEDHENVLRECASKLDNQYTITGLIPENELLSFYHQSDLYVATSKYEPYGLTILEAMSCGIDVVVRSTMAAAQHLFCNIPELLERNIFDTPQELAEIITSHLEGSWKIEKGLLQRIIHHHRWENRAMEYLQIFRQLIKVS